jgi:hypothetical protein
MREVTRRFGIETKSYYAFGCTVGKPSAVQQEILEDLVRIRRRSRFDPGLHPWNNTDFANRCFNMVAKAYLKRKVEALDVHNSQKMRK